MKPGEVRAKTDARTTLADLASVPRCEVCGRRIYIHWVMLCIECDIWSRKVVEPVRGINAMYPIGWPE
jgi:hypothetical protein